jgi:flagellum-specific ATP synthase
MTGAITHAAAALLSEVPSLSAGPRRIGTLVSHDGVMLEAVGLSQPVGSSVRVCTADGKRVCAEIVGFRGDHSLMMPLDGAAAYAAGARVEPAPGEQLVACGPALLGRVVDARGRPLDDLGPIASSTLWPLEGKRSNPLARGRITEPFDIGVRAVNGLLSTGVGQRIAIIAGSGVGKSVLMGQMLSGAQCDVIVAGLVGERSREISDFLEMRLAGRVRDKAVVVAVPADHPPILRLRAAMRATAIAEQFRDEGKRVLLLIDSLTRVAHAQREIGLALGEPPTMKGYPPSALCLIPALIERAGNDTRSGGSITALYTVLADGGDIEDPIVDAARAIVDGHIILSRALAEEGIYPAINIAASLSRIMADVGDDAHLRAAAHFRRLWSSYADNRDLLLMGAYTPGSDALLDEAIARREEMAGFVSQRPDERIDLKASREALVKGFGS